MSASNPETAPNPLVEHPVIKTAQETVVEHALRLIGQLGLDETDKMLFSRKLASYGQSGDLNIITSVLNDLGVNSPSAEWTAQIHHVGELLGLLGDLRHHAVLGSLSLLKTQEQSVYDGFSAKLLILANGVDLGLATFSNLRQDLDYRTINHKLLYYLSQIPIT